MFKNQMEIVHNHGNGYRDWLPERFSLERVNFHNVFQWQRIHTKGLFISLFTEL